MTSDTKLYVNGRFVTLSDSPSAAEAVAVRGGRIVQVGSTEDVLRVPHPREIIDLNGRTVVPGFVDGHCHLEMAVVAEAFQPKVHTPPYRSLADIKRVLEQRREAKPHGWIVARGSFAMQDHVAERRLFAREDLDRISPSEPIAVLAGFHVASLNTPALRELGILDGNVARGVTVHRSPGGEPNGVVTEIWDRLPTAPESDVLQALRRHVVNMFVANGVTSVCTIPTSPDDVRALTEASRSGMPLRIFLYHHVPRLLDLPSLTNAGFTTSFGNDRLRFGGVKIFVDGEGGDGLGNPIDDIKWDQSELFRFVREASNARIQVWMHAVTLTGIDLAARAIAAVHPDGSNPMRHRIEHGADYLDLTQLDQLRSAGCLLVTTPHFMSAVAEDTSPSLQPLRSVIDGGFRPIGGSDATGTVPDGVSPLFNIACAATRRTKFGYTVGEDQAIKPEEALRMFTTWAAHGCFAETSIGQIQVGFLADMAVLSANPVSAHPDQLSAIRVEATILGGDIVFDRSGGNQWGS